MRAITIGKAIKKNIKTAMLKPTLFPSIAAVAAMCNAAVKDKPLNQNRAASIRQTKSTVQSMMIRAPTTPERQ